MKKIKLIFFSLLLTITLVSPHISFAQVLGDAGNVATQTGGAVTSANSGVCPVVTNITTLFSYAICLLQSFVVPFLVGIALVMFLAGIVKYVASGDNEEKKDAGKGLMIFGIIALFVMTAVWGLVKILYTTILPGKAFEIPNLPPQATSPFQ